MAIRLSNHRKEKAYKKYSILPNSRQKKMNLTKKRLTTENATLRVSVSKCSLPCFPMTNHYYSHTKKQIISGKALRIMFFS